MSIYKSGVPGDEVAVVSIFKRTFGRRASSRLFWATSFVAVISGDKDRRRYFERRGSSPCAISDDEARRHYFERRVSSPLFRATRIVAARYFERRGNCCNTSHTAVCVSIVTIILCVYCCNYLTMRYMHEWGHPLDVPYTADTRCSVRRLTMS